MALTTALANSFRLREAAAVVASGGDAGDDGGDPPHGRRGHGSDNVDMARATNEMYDVALQRTTAARYRGRFEQRSCIA